MGQRSILSGRVGSPLDDRDYATAQRLLRRLDGRTLLKLSRTYWRPSIARIMRRLRDFFEALGCRKGAAAPQVNGSAPASPAPPQPATSAGGPTASDSQNKTQQKYVMSPFEVIPLADAAYRRPPPQAEKAKSRRLRPLLLGTLMLFAIFGASEIYGSPLNWTFPTTKSQAIAGLTSVADVLKADLEAIMGQSAREEGRSATPDPSATLTQLTDRLDQIEHEYGARLDKLSERVDQDSSSRFADIAARLDKLEKKVALAAAPPASESSDVVARLDKLEKKVAVAAAPSSEIAGLTTRLNKLEKRSVVAGASSANPLPPAAPKQSSLMARVDPSAPNESARSDNPAPLLRDYSVEDARDGIAVVDSRSGPPTAAVSHISRWTPSSSM